MNIQLLCDACINQMKVLRRSAQTLRSYSTTYKQFIDFVNDEQESEMIINLDSDELDELSFKKYILKYTTSLSESNMKSTSINTKRTHIRALCNYAFKNNYIHIPINDISYLKRIKE